MLPTLFGRIQTRIFVIAVIGGLWAHRHQPAPARATARVSDKYKAMYGVLLIVGVVGILWELVYHGLMQFRWEKDWPTLFGLVVGIPEGHRRLRHRDQRRPVVDREHHRQRSSSSASSPPGSSPGCG